MNAAGRLRSWLIAALIALVAAGAALLLQRHLDPMRRMAAPGLFPANDDARGWAALPRLTGTTAVIAGPTQDPGVSRTHPYVTFAGGRYLAMWSQSPGGEWSQGYQVKYATSADGLAWSPPRPLTNPAPVGWRRFARGFWQREDRLHALVSQDEMGPYFGPGLALYALPLTPHGFGPARLVGPSMINNFAPERAPDGAWLFASRRPPMRIGFMRGGVRALSDWRAVPVPTPERRLGFAYWPIALGSVRFNLRYPVIADPMLDEPVWWRAADGRLIGMFRSNDRPRLYRAVSEDGGASWSGPVATDFPNAISKLATLRLSSGLFVLVSNPRLQRRGRLRAPLTLAVSRDGMVFDAAFVLYDAPTRARRDTAGRKAGYYYPQLSEHAGALFVAYTHNGEDIEVTRLSLAGIAAAYRAARGDS